MRILILITSLLASFNMFYHYSIMWGPIRAKTFCLVEIFRLILFYAVCYYYVYKASGLLENRRILIYVLRSLFLIGIIMIITFGTIFMVDIDIYVNSGGKSGLNPANLCMEVTFQLYRYFPYLIQAILLFAYLRIKNTVQSYQQ